METKRGCWISWNWIWLLRPTVYMLIIKPRSFVKAVCALTSKLPSRSRLDNFFFMIVGCQFLLTRRCKFWRHTKWRGEWRAPAHLSKERSRHEKLSISRPSASSLYFLADLLIGFWHYVPTLHYLSCRKPMRISQANPRSRSSYKPSEIQQLLRR